MLFNCNVSNSIIKGTLQLGQFLWIQCRVVILCIQLFVKVKGNGIDVCSIQYCVFDITQLRNKITRHNIESKRRWYLSTCTLYTMRPIIFTLTHDCGGCQYKIICYIFNVKPLSVNATISYSHGTTVESGKDNNILWTEYYFVLNSNAVWCISQSLG